MPCRWIWTGTQPWDPHPLLPHACPEGQTCPPPDGDGAYIGEERETNCEGPA